MFYNYFKTAFRNLLRNKGYAAINIVGIAVGIAACLLIFLVIQFEISFYNFYKRKNKIYSAGFFFPLSSQLQINFSRIKKVAYIFQNEDQIKIVYNCLQQIFFINTGIATLF